MRLRAALGMALGALALTAPTASAALAPPPTVLGFETAPDGILDSDLYAAQGVTLEAPEGIGFCGGSEAAAAPQFCANVVHPGLGSERSLESVHR